MVRLILAEMMFATSAVLSYSHVFRPVLLRVPVTFRH